MINLCKHCYAVLGYDKKYSFIRELNTKCNKCMSGLKVEDTIDVDEAMVYLIRVFYYKFGIRTYYSCEGHLCNKKFSESYMVIDDKPIVRDIVSNVKDVLDIDIRKDGRGKVRLTFNIKSDICIYWFMIAKAEFFNKFYQRLTSAKCEINITEGDVHVNRQ
jgi:hypothetical protein